MALGNSQVSWGFFKGPSEESYRKYFPKNNKFDPKAFINCVNAYTQYQTSWDCGRRNEKGKIITKANEAIAKFNDPNPGTAKQAREEFFRIISAAAKSLTSYWFGAQTRGSEMMAKFRDAFAETYPEVVNTAPRHKR